MKWLALSFSLLLSAVPLAKAATAASGELAWTAHSNLMKDNEGRLFYPPTYPNGALIRVNAEDGSPLWSKDLPGFAYFYAACSESDRIFVLAGTDLIAINPETGSTYWTYQHEGAGFPTLTCMPRSNEIFITYGESSNHIAAIQKYSGQKVWDYEAGPYSYIFNSDWENYYINRSVNGVNRVDALSAWNGEIRWSRDLDKEHYSFVDPQGRVFVSGAGEITRLNRSTGQDQWKFKAEGEWAYLEYNNSGVIYVHENFKVSRVDLETGVVLWSQPLENSKDAYSQTVLLNSGDLLVRTTYFLEGKAKNAYLEKDNGVIRWENHMDSSQGYIAEDAAQNLYQIQNLKLIAFDKQSGNTRWAFELPAEQNQTIFQVYGQGESFYLTYGNLGKYPPMGLVRLNANDGRLVWQQFIGSPFSIVNWDAERVYIASYLSGESQAFLR